MQYKKTVKIITIPVMIMNLISNYFEYKKENYNNIDILKNQKSNIKNHDNITTTTINDSNTISLIQTTNDNSITDYNFVAVGDWYCNEETKKQ
jgi:regulatory protein YycI of two-component signal transduction system YycFG